MPRALLALGLGLLLAAPGRADLGPPRPMRTIFVDHKVTADKEFPDHLFFLVLGDPERGPKVVPAKIGPKTPLDIPGAPRGTGAGRTCGLVAVPKTALKGYATEKAFLQALVKGAVEGQVQAKTNFDSVQTVLGNDRRTKALSEWKLERIEKGEIVLTEKDAPPPRKNPLKGDGGAPEEEAEETAPGVTAHTPRGGLWAAGLCAALAALLGGLWLAGRARRV